MGVCESFCSRRTKKVNRYARPSALLRGESVFRITSMSYLVTSVLKCFPLFSFFFSLPRQKKVIFEEDSQFFCFAIIVNFMCEVWDLNWYRLTFALPSSCCGNNCRHLDCKLLSHLKLREIKIWKWQFWTNQLNSWV